MNPALLGDSAFGLKIKRHQYAIQIKYLNKIQGNTISNEFRINNRDITGISSLRE
jgi:hypothetical protein